MNIKIHIPTPDNKKPIHNFINSKAPYGISISDDLSTVTTQIKYEPTHYNDFKDNLLSFYMDNEAQFKLMYVHNITINDFFKNNLLKLKEDYQWLLTYWEDGETHIIAMYDNFEKACQEIPFLENQHQFINIIAILPNQKLNITI